MPATGTMSITFPRGAHMRQLLLVLISVHLAALSGGELLVKIPPGINLKVQEVRADLPARIETMGGYDRIEIVIYYFSLGVEKFSYTDNNAIQESLMKGEIKALIKLKKKNVLRKALFIAAPGASKEQLLRNFRQVVSDTLGKQ
jgi:hypothetical protein